MSERLTVLESAIYQYVDDNQRYFDVTYTRIVNGVRQLFPDATLDDIDGAISSLYRRAIIERTYSGSYEVPEAGR